MVVVVGCVGGGACICTCFSAGVVVVGVVVVGGGGDVVGGSGICVWKAGDGSVVVMGHDVAEGSVHLGC